MKYQYCEKSRCPYYRPNAIKKYSACGYVSFRGSAAVYVPEVKKNQCLYGEIKNETLSEKTKN